MHSRNGMRTHSKPEVALQLGAEIAASAKTEKKNKDTTGAARSSIWCPMTLWVVGREETGNRDGAGRYRLTQ